MTSAPDYRWPDPRQRQMPLGLLRRALFHTAHWVGKLIGSADCTKRIVVIRNDGIGDALLFEPTLRSLARRYHEHTIHLWATAAIGDLYSAAPVVHVRQRVPRAGKGGNLSYISSARWHLRMGYLLGRYRFDLAFYPVHSAEPMGNWLLKSAQATQKWVARSDLQNQFEQQRADTHAVATHVLGSDSPGHELSRNAELATHWASRIDADRPRLYSNETFEASADARMNGWRTLAKLHQASHVIGVVPSASMPVKHLSVSQWGATLRLFWNRHRALPILIGGDDDMTVLSEISQSLGQLPHAVLHESLRLPEYAALLSRFDLVIAVDTAAAHMAIAQETPTVALVGAGHPGRFLPWPHASHAITITHPVICGGCNLRCNQPEPYCLTRIEPGQIVSAGAQLLLKPSMRAIAS